MNLWYLNETPTSLDLGNFQFAGAAWVPVHTLGDSGVRQELGASARRT